MIDKVKKKTLQAIADRGGKATKRHAKEKVKAAVDPLAEKLDKLSKSVAATDKNNETLSKTVAALSKENEKLSADLIKVHEANEALSKSVTALLMRGRIKKASIVRGKKIAGTDFEPINSVNYEYDDGYH